MLDELFFKEGAERHKSNYIFFGFVMTVIGWIFTVMFFGLKSSAAQILTISLLLTPAIIKLLRKEEMMARNEGYKHIFKNHKNIFEIYIFILAGVFLAFFIIQLIVLNFPQTFNQTFAFQVNYINSDQQLSYDMLDSIGKHESPLASLGALLAKGIFVVILAFALSFFYGAGGVFFIVTSASIFSTLILYAVKSTTFYLFSVFFLIMFFLLLIPIILSSIAGGVISRAFVHEKIRSKHMTNVMKDGTYLFITALILTIIFGVLWYAAVYILRSFV